MTDYARPLFVPRPRPLMGIVNRIAPWFAILAIGFVIGMAQGAIQSDSHWADKIVSRSVVDPSGVALPVYEDALGNVYYTHKEVRP